MAAEVSERAENTELGLRKEVKAREVLPVERRQLKLWARINLFKRVGREEKANKDRASGGMAR